MAHFIGRERHLVVNILKAPQSKKELMPQNSTYMKFGSNLSDESITYIDSHINGRRFILMSN